MRFVASVSVCLALAACATAPGAPMGPGEGQASSYLYLCPGGNISNAPPATARGRLVNYDPVVLIGGTALLRSPVNACVSSGFGPRRRGAGRFHDGVDLYTGSPRRVSAGGDGVIDFIGDQRGYGRTIVIRHGRGVRTRYAHLSSYARNLKQGDRVSRGQTIAMTGDTGNATAVHLHYEILVRGGPVNPLTVGR